MKTISLTSQPSNGYSGISGFSGGNGLSGISGYSGANGANGINGISGYSGVNGTTGTNGTNGTNGQSGVSGATGQSGYSGRSGYSGYAGNLSAYAPLAGANFTGTVNAPKFAGNVLLAGGGSVPSGSRGVIDTVNANSISAPAPWSSTSNPMTLSYTSGPGQIANGATYTAKLWTYKLYGGLPVFCDSPYSFWGQDHGGSADYVDSVTLAWDSQSGQVDGFVIVLTGANWYVAEGNYCVIADGTATSINLQVKNSSWSDSQTWYYDANAVSGAIFNSSPTCGTFIDFAGNLNFTDSANWCSMVLGPRSLSYYGLNPSPAPNPLNGLFGWDVYGSGLDVNYITSFYFSLAGTKRLNVNSAGAQVVGSFQSTNIDTETAPTAISGHTGCTFSQPFAGTYYKKVIIYLSAYTGTAVAVSFPHEFTKTPSIVKNDTTCTLPSLTTSGCTITGTSQTGFIILEGY